MRYEIRETRLARSHSQQECGEESYATTTKREGPDRRVAAVVG